MSDDTWRIDDKITIERGKGGWRIQVLRGLQKDATPGGIVGNLGFIHDTPEEALAALRRALEE